MLSFNDGHRSSFSSFPVPNALIENIVAAFAALGRFPLVGSGVGEFLGSRVVRLYILMKAGDRGHF